MGRPPSEVSVAKPSRLVTRRRFLLLATAGAGAALLEACGPAPAATPTAPAATPPAAPPAAPTPAPTPAAPTATKAGPATVAPVRRPTGTLRVAIDGDVDNLDPHQTSTESYFDTFAFLAFDFLAMVNEKLELEPRLAERWEYGSDAKSVTVYLRRNAKFHNGRALTAKDVAYTFERAKSQGFWTTSSAGQVEKTELLDDYTIKFSLSAPNAYFMFDATNVAIVPQEAADALKNAPIGSGPYRFVDHVRNDRWTLEAFADYWDPSGVTLERVVARVLPDVSAAIANLESGQLDAVRRVTVSDAKRFQNNPNVQVVKSRPGADVHFIHLTGKNNPHILQNKKVRQAVAFALDRKAVNEVVFGGEGQAIGSPLSPALAHYYDPGRYTFDPQQTRRLLRDVGVSGLEFTIDCHQGIPASEQTALIWQQGLQQAGVKLNVRVNEAAVWLDKYLKQDYDVIYNTFPTTGDPNRFFTLIINRFRRAGVYTAENGYDQAMLNELMPAAKAELDPERSKELLKRMQELVADELPVLPVVAGPTYSLVSSKVQGWINLPTSLHDLRRVTVRA